MCVGGSEESVKARPTAHNVRVGGWMGWELWGSVKIGLIGENQVGGVFGIVMGSAVCGGGVRLEQNESQ